MGVASTREQRRPEKGSVRGSAELPNRVSACAPLRGERLRGPGKRERLFEDRDGSRGRDADAGRGGHRDRLVDYGRAGESKAGGSLELPSRVRSDSLSPL